MKILGIETSCDETAAAIIDGGRVMSNVVSSQVELHGQFYGVVPELASRAHQQKIAGVIEQAVSDAFPGSSLKDLPDLVDAVAYTQGPGLAGALLVGKVAAQTLASVHALPLIGINHLEGHAFAIEFAESIRFPFISLIVSGGHTDLVLVRGYGDYRVLGRTRDDAAGEAFDKVAKLLKLGYPGGPVIDRLAVSGDAAAVNFPRPILAGTWDFSFSGLKTAVLYHVQKDQYLSRVLEMTDKSAVIPAKAGVRQKHLPDPGGVRGDERIANLCASFQEAVVDTLVEKTLLAARKFKAPSVVVGGGVAANSRLRKLFAEAGADRGVDVRFPPKGLCTDNGAMIARVAWLRMRAHRLPKRFRIDPSMAMRNW